MTVPALSTPVVRLSSVFRSAASALAFVVVRFTPAATAMAPAFFVESSSCSIVPEIVVAAVAVIRPLVSLSSVLRSSALMLTSETVTASSPRPEIVPTVFAAYAALTSARLPERAVTEPAFTTPVVLPSSALSTEAPSEVSLSVTASLPRPLIWIAAADNVASTAIAVPVIVVTVEASIVPLVLLLSVFRSAAAAVVSLSTTASSPRPEIWPAPFAA